MGVEYITIGDIEKELREYLQQHPEEWDNN